jgi:hypothetical protein
VNWIILWELNLDSEFNDKVLRFQVELDSDNISCGVLAVTQAVYVP